MADFTPEEDLALVAAAARRAAGIALGYFRRDPRVWWKDGGSPVSEADYAVDAFLKETLIAARPDYGWLSEETAAIGGTTSRSRFFVVDPIDGTRAFLRGDADWCVSIAVVESGRPIVGVIDAPAHGEVFAADALGPPRLNGDVIETACAAADGRLRVSIPDSLRRDIPAADAAGLSLAGAIPSLAYRLALVAAGRLDGALIRPRANDWDIAAGDLIIERAGGSLGDIDLNPRIYQPEGMRHGLLIAAAEHALPRLQSLAAAGAESGDRRRGSSSG